MLSMDEFDQLRPYVDVNFEGAPSHLIEKLDAELRGTPGPELDTAPPFPAYKGPGFLGHKVGLMTEIQGD